MSEGGRTITWSLEDPPPEELLVIAPQYGLARWAEGAKPRGAEQIEVLLAPGRRITSVKLFPRTGEVLAPETLEAALDELARRLPKPPE